MNWTDERVALLKKLWSEGLSASQIAGQLGGVSRNAVVGKVHRLKLSARGRVTAAPARQKKSKPETEKVARVNGVSAPRTQTATIATQAPTPSFIAEEEYVRPVQDNVVVPISRRLKLVELTERTCKWPNGDPLSEDFNYCGNDAAETGPYCKYHAKLAFVPQEKRRKYYS